ncbi:MAG TPA: NAD(P)H-binding protein [Gaiellales bacterium]|nr:NAD(P)H-binding protein [Gaiellales bacterium]
MKVLVTGATGYVGTAVVRRLRAAGHEVRPFSRAAGGDISDPAAVAQTMEGVDAAVNLVAILEGSQDEFERVIAGGARNVVAAAQAAGVRRLLHMSAVGVTEEHAALTGYWGGKWRAKQAVVGSDLDWTVFEPSFVFTQGGGAFREFERLARLPVVPVIGNGRYRHQPVWLGDVAEAFARALERPETIRKTYPLGGPQVFTFNELLDELARVTGHRAHRKLHAPAGFVRLQAKVLLRHLPPPLRVTPDQITMLLAGTECDLTAMREGLGIEPASIGEAYTKSV